MLITCPTTRRAVPIVRRHGLHCAVEGTSCVVAVAETMHARHPTDPCSRHHRRQSTWACPVLPDDVDAVVPFDPHRRDLDPLHRHWYTRTMTM